MTKWLIPGQRIRLSVSGRWGRQSFTITRSGIRLTLASMPLQQTFDSAITREPINPAVIPGRPSTSMGGRLSLAVVSQQMIWFEFSDICGGPRSPSDYIAIAGEYATVFISSIPQFDRSTEDEARRFVSLIDEFYDRRVNLICTAQANILDLYQGDRLTFEFERTASRLQEMQSKEYFRTNI